MFYVWYATYKFGIVAQQVRVYKRIRPVQHTFHHLDTEKNKSLWRQEVEHENVFKLLEYCLSEKYFLHFVLLLWHF